MDSKQVEELYPEYRLSFTEKIIPLIRLGMSFKVEGAQGVGKSKYLRYVTSSEIIRNKFLKNSNIKFFYIDLNLLYNNEPNQLIELIGHELGVNSPNTKSIEEKIAKVLEEYKFVYFIIDHAEKLIECDESVTRYIRGIRDVFNSNLGIIIGCENAVAFNSEKFKHLNQFTSLVFTLGLLDTDEIKMNISHFAKLLKVKLTEDEISMIASSTRGFPVFIKRVLLEIVAGKSPREAIRVTEEIPFTLSEATKSPDSVLDTAIKHLTKSEYLIFKEIYSARGKVVTRDQLASILNPETEGEGVSNESIDQIVSRVRKSLKRSNFNIEIKTKRGIGYYL